MLYVHNQIKYDYALRIIHCVFIIHNNFEVGNLCLIVCGNRVVTNCMHLFYYIKSYSLL